MSCKLRVAFSDNTESIKVLYAVNFSVPREKVICQKDRVDWRFRAKNRGFSEKGRLKARPLSACLLKAMKRSMVYIMPRRHVQLLKMHSHQDDREDSSPSTTFLSLLQEKEG